MAVMPITPDEAVAVARAHGLGLNDAAALADLADDRAAAERIAAEFAAPAPSLAEQLAADPGRKDQVIQSAIAAKRATRPRTDHNGRVLVAAEED